MRLYSPSSSLPEGPALRADSHLDCCAEREEKTSAIEGKAKEWEMYTTPYTTGWETWPKCGSMDTMH